MSTELITQADRSKLVETLNNSLYVGAKPASIDMVIDYCQAAHLDPMQKPVHIVPMNTKNPVSGEYEWRDVVMPGIGLYRIQADRSGTMAGISEPEFGPMIEQAFRDKKGNNVTVSFPEWCKVTVRKLVGDHIVDFVAKEYWLENYATDSRNSTAPNAMWARRVRGQIAKCAEAQALRKAFPEVGAAPTAEEMEGKVLERDMGYANVVEQTRTEVRQELPPMDDVRFNNAYDKWKLAIQDKLKTKADMKAFLSAKYTLSEEQLASINDIEEAV